MPARFVTLLLLGLAASLAGCAGPAPRLPPNFTPIEPRVDAVAGAVLALPLEIEAPSKPAAVRARLDDGRRLDARLWWIQTDRPDADLAGWLRDAPVRTVHRAGSSLAGTGDGYWLATVPLPRETFGQGLWLGRSRIPLRWLPDPAALLRDVAEDSPSAERPWTHPAPGVLDAGGAVADMAARLRADPLRRWRHRLLADGLEPAEDPARPGLDGLIARDGAFDDPVLEALALQRENRWRVALGWLWVDDPAAADALKRRLAATVFAGEDRYPAWPTDPVALARLRQALLRVTRETGERAASARRFLDAQPPAAARVVERAKPLSGVQATTVELTNLGALDALAWVSGDGAAPQLEPIPPRTAARRSVVQATSLQLSRSVLVAHVGAWALELPIAGRATPVTPPGLTVGPLVRPWTLDAFLRSDSAAQSLPGAAWRTAGRLAPAPDGTGWQLYIECARGPGDLGDDAVTVHTGPRGQGESVTVRADGSTPGVRVEVSPDRWRAWIPLPGLVEYPSLAVERVDARGVRTTWPGRAAPWDTTLAREPIDLGAWDPISPR